MITVHHLENSRSQRILWLLEELELDYEVKRYERDPKTMLAPASLKQVHPLGKSPVITDGDVTLAESGAIIEYLVDYRANGRLAPAPGTRERVDYTYWLHYAEGSLMPLLVFKLVIGRIPTRPMPFFARPIARRISSGLQAQFLDPRIGENLAYLEHELSGRDWFVGDSFTAADVQLSFPLEGAAARGGLDDRYPRLSGFLQRIHERPAYQRALERGGPYQLLT
ncbi:MAG TPA: glutathione S-transferase [Gammaproteobacteria bacterium]|nr:glutathione S-transferase [Gammaproteobacteria bacterium]